MLHPNRQPDHARADAHPLPLRRWDVGMGHGRRVLGEEVGDVAGMRRLKTSVVTTE